MDITGPLADCLFNKGTHQLYNRCITYICICIVVCCSSTKLCPLLSKSSGCIQCLRCAVASVDCRKNISGCSNVRLYLQVCHDRDVVDRSHIHRICHCKMKDIGIVGIQFKGNAGIFLEKVHADQISDFFRDRHACQLNDFKPQLHLEGTNDHILSDKAIIYQNFTDFLAASLLQFQGFL